MRNKVDAASTIPALFLNLYLRGAKTEIFEQKDSAHLTGAVFTMFTLDDIRNDLKWDIDKFIQDLLRFCGSGC